MPSRPPAFAVIVEWVPICGYAFHLIGYSCDGSFTPPNAGSWCMNGVSLTCETQSVCMGDRYKA
jgi:hypothetical protein